MKTKLKMIMAAALVLIIQTTALQAQQQEMPERDREEQRFRNHKQKPKGLPIPNLTGEQEESLKALHIQLEKEALPLKNQLREKQARLQTLVTAENYDQKATEKVVEDIGELKTDLMKLKVSHDQSIRSLLTDEQLIFFNKHQSMRIKKKKGKRG